MHSIALIPVAFKSRAAVEGLSLSWLHSQLTWYGSVKSKILEAFQSCSVCVCLSGGRWPGAGLPPDLSVEMYQHCLGLHQWSLQACPAQPLSLKALGGHMAFPPSLNVCKDRCLLEFTHTVQASLLTALSCVQIKCLCGSSMVGMPWRRICWCRIADLLDECLWICLHLGSNKTTENHSFSMRVGHFWWHEWQWQLTTYVQKFEKNQV